MTFKEKVVYQIYPKSYKDSNGDGIGDLRGIIEKVPYLAELGVDMLWLNPFYPSPQKDNGYDIADYCGIDPTFGTMADFDELVTTAQASGIEIMLDMVLNHVSTAHPWFQKALAGDPLYQEYFILRDEPTDWVSKFGGNAWAPFGETGKYYLHLFDSTQADLNWRNEKVREELFDVVRFWQDRGVKGFRFDVINLIGKDKELKDNPINDGKPEYTDRPITHEYLREMNQATFGNNPEIVTVGEMSSTTIENCLLYTEPTRNELTMTFNFHHLKVDYQEGKKWTIMPFDFRELKRLLHTWGEEMSNGNGWNAWFWNNHDQPRALNRFVDTKEYRIEGAKMLAAAIHLNRGTPYIYMGEEIGMVDPAYSSIDDYKDIESKNAYQELLEQGKSAEEAFAIIQAKSRDNARTPMQWDASPTAGFTTGVPWLGLAADHEQINVEEELANPDIFRFYQKLIRLRKEKQVISEGTYTPFLPEHPQIYGYLREYGEEQVLVLTNFYEKEISVELPDKWLSAEVIVNNYTNENWVDEGVLKPYQAVALLLKEK